MYVFREECHMIMMAEMRKKYGGFQANPPAEPPERESSADILPPVLGED